MECVLMQAWKKTSAYLRYHSWYADTLGIDVQALRVLPFIREIQARLQNPNQWEARPLELVPAPKSQRWAYAKGQWEPQETQIEKKLRPLAHVDLQDQVVATAMMLCLADRVETKLGDPRLQITTGENRSKVLAYGHRLFCDAEDNSRLRHRWGSSKLYRAYFRDYQTFLERPKTVARELDSEDEDLEVAIVQSDLSKFYDRVRPVLLHEKLRLFQESVDESPFFDLAERVFNWRWADATRADRYEKEHQINEFGKVALPQGLVASGFFANIALIDFDTALRQKIGTVIDEDSQLLLRDACYYVDDFRLVLTLPRKAPQINESRVKDLVVKTLENALAVAAPGLEVSKEKTEVTIEGREKRFLVRQSREAARIQTQVSGTFDMLHGTELIGAIEGFFHTQQRYSTSADNEIDGLLVGVPDMADDTAARFAAGRMRRTFRSLRPLLPDEPEPERGNEDEEIDDPFPRAGLVLSKSQLDERGKFFSALLIDQWIKNPGNVRLLRIAFDLYPDREFLDEVLKLLRAGWQSPRVRKAKREVRLYCLSELFRAGATETGIVPDDETECLPSETSIEDYHQRLVQEAQDIFSAYISSTAPTSRFPWYLMQQVFLYLAVRNQVPDSVLRTNARGGNLLRHYWRLLKFLRGHVPSNLEERSLYLIESSTAFGIADFGCLESISRISREFLARVNSISPLVAKALWKKFGSRSGIKAKQAAVRFGLEARISVPTERTLAHLTPESDNSFHEEENLLQLAKFLLSREPSTFEKAVLPSKVLFSLQENPRPQGYEFGKVVADSFGLKTTSDYANDLFEPPDWCENNEDCQRFNVGLLLRYALRGSTDFLSSNTQHTRLRGPRYSKPVSHWEQQRYSGYQGRDAFGPPWLPLSSFTEELLFELLRWPGSGVETQIVPVPSLLQKVTQRLERLVKRRGQFTSTTFLDQLAPWPGKVPLGDVERPLRIGIVQSVIPTVEDYKDLADPKLDGKDIRLRGKAHLAAIMEGIAQMLRVRDTHRNSPGMNRRSIDLLVFPELSIHPRDIDPLILPFVRQYRCIVLLGQIYHHRDFHPNSPLINSGLWLIPEWRRSHGLQIKRIEQGKANLTDAEHKFSPAPVGFRPVQWLIEYQWNAQERPLRLSASICYDATDLALAADLRSRSDLYIVCALNKDVGTFDRMTEALHYHMFQGVALVNNGQFGGSSFFMPLGNTHEREIFHLHGQPQASIAFVDVNPRKLVHRPDQSLKGEQPHGEWKTPPANWQNSRGPT